MITKDGTASGVILARHLDVGMSLRDAIRLATVDHAKEKGCRFDNPGYCERIEAAMKEAGCTAIEAEETCLAAVVPLANEMPLETAPVATKIGATGKLEYTTDGWIVVFDDGSQFPIMRSSKLPEVSRASHHS